MTQLTNLVQFPGLGLSFHLNRVAFSIGDIRENSKIWYALRQERPFRQCVCWKKKAFAVQCLKHRQPV